MTRSNSQARRSRWLLAAAPLALAMTLAACSEDAPGTGGSGSANPSDEPQTITFTYVQANPDETYYDTLAKDFEAANPGVTVKQNKIALTAADQTIPTQLQAGNGPDVFWINAGSGIQTSVGQLGKAGLLLPLDSSVYAGIPESQMAGYDLDGKTYGVPSSSQVNGSVFNDELAQSVGVNVTATSTINDITAQCPKAVAKGQSVYGLAGSTPQNNGILAVSIAGSAVYGVNPNWNQDRTDGKTTFASTEGWKQTLQAIVDLNGAGCFQKGAAGAGFDALTNGAASGKLYGFFAPSGAAKSIMDGSGGRAKLIVLPAPAPAGVAQKLTLSSNTGLAGNAATKSPSLVQKFLAFSVSAAESKKIADAQGSIPIGEVTASSLLPQYAPVADLVTSGNTIAYGADGWPNPEVYNALGTGITGLLTGQKSIDDVLNAMDAAWG
jgi:raffinose/stachyose/melibiose transport system substrate-binding protein